MPNVTDIQTRAEQHFEEEVLGVWSRVTEDGKIEQFEIVELREALSNHRRYFPAIRTGRKLKQAAGRSTDPEYIKDLADSYLYATSQLPDAA